MTTWPSARDRAPPARARTAPLPARAAAQTAHRVQGLEWLGRLLDAVPIDSRTRERTHGLYVAGLLAVLQGDCAAGKRQSRESLALCREIDDPNRGARVLDGLTWLSIRQGDYPQAEVPARESVDSARAVGDRWMLLTSPASARRSRSARH